MASENYSSNCLLLSISSLQHLIFTSGEGTLCSVTHQANFFPIFGMHLKNNLPQKLLCTPLLDLPSTKIVLQYSSYFRYWCFHSHLSASDQFTRSSRTGMEMYPPQYTYHPPVWVPYVHYNKIQTFSHLWWFNLRYFYCTTVLWILIFS
jgi:hypothetical protein